MFVCTAQPEREKRLECTRCFPPGTGFHLLQLSYSTINAGIELRFGNPLEMAYTTTDASSVSPLTSECDSPIGRDHSSDAKLEDHLLPFDDDDDVDVGRSKRGKSYRRQMIILHTGIIFAYTIILLGGLYSLWRRSGLRDDVVFGASNTARDCFSLIFWLVNNQNGADYLM